jgi:hypothetical protein
MSEDCPRWFIVAAYLIVLVTGFAGIWYLLIWLSIYHPGNRSLFEFFNLLLGFIIIFLFSGYMLIKMLFPVRTGPLLVPH